MPLVRRLAAILIATLACLAVLPADALAGTPEEDFAAAENTFRFQDYKTAEAMLRALLYPEVRLTSPDQVTRAHEYLGASYFWLRDDKRMEEEFTALLTRSPTHKLDPFYYPPALMERFDALRKRLVELHIISLEPPRVAEPVRCQREEKTVVQRSRFVSFLPFGIGQFQSNEVTKGSLFLTGEVVALGLNIGAWGAAESLRGSDGLYSSSDADLARKLRIVQYVALGTFVALAVWDVVDSALHFVPEDTSVQVVPCPPPPSKDPGAVAPFAAGAVCVRWGR
jgi:hypothetical protein